MKEPCITLDVSKGKSYYQGFLSIDQPISKAQPIDHNLTDFKKIIDLKKTIEDKSGISPVVVFESTGIYHKGLQQFLEDNNLKYVIMSPLAAAKIRKATIRSAKTDARDCKSIAKAYYLGDFEVFTKQSDLFRNLKENHRHYQFLIEEQKRWKVEFRRLLDIVYPNFDKLYSNMYSDIPMFVLNNYHHPNKLKKVKLEDLAKKMEKETYRQYDYCLYEATKIKKYLDNCVSGCNEKDIVCLSFGISVHMLKEQIKLVNKSLDSLIALAKQTPYFLILKSIPGVGDKLAVSIIAEMGDINNFSSADKLVAFAGLDPTVYQSGKQTGEHLKITKKGNKRLRTSLYLACQVACQKRMKENKIKSFYNKKKQQDRPLSTKAAYIACSNKLLRIIHSLCKNGCLFN
jgi:transposase